MEDKLRKISKALQSIPENELTKTIIKPLFEKMGFLKVEFYGGTDEEGKDLLIWEQDNFEDLRLSVAQVKHFKFSNSAGHSQSLQTIINQLVMCFTKSLFYSDKSVHNPFEAILISSHEIDSKNIKSRFDLNPTLIDRKIKIIDGLKLAQLLIKNCPETVRNLINEEVDFTYFSSDTLNNEILLKALSIDQPKAIKNIYTDIDFSLGKASTKLLFDNEFVGENKKFNLERNDWEYFKIKISYLNDEIKGWLVEEPISEIEENFEKELKAYYNWENISKKLSEEFEKAKKSLQELSKLHEKEKNLFLKKSRDLNILERKVNIDKDGKQKIALLKKELKSLKQEFEPFTKQELILERHEEQLNRHFRNEPSTRYRFQLNGLLIGDWLTSRKNSIKQKLKIFNKVAPSLGELKNYLIDCSNIFELSSIILDTIECRQCLNLDSSIVSRLNFDSTRFKLSIDKVFDTGLNLTLLGHAGGGKTTSLQMYALSKKSNKDKTVIWAPLAQLVPNWTQNNTDFKIEYKILNLDLAVGEYLRSKGVSISNEQFRSTLSSKNVVILFDGLDEAIRSNEWLPEALNSIAKKYSGKLQVIVTSRMSGPFVERLNFFTVSLLAFTQAQRNEFVDKWFEGQNTDIPDKIKSHFANNKAIDEITRNPLLTTTLCVLAKHDLPLPQTEINLYNDRLKLLTGYYDNVKNIKARISTSPQNLEFLAKKLAYFLHSKNKRQESVENLENMAISALISKLNREQSIIAFHELIDPCNIIVPMSNTGEYGFGHLRYQEHLAASELASNRSIDILGLLGVKLQWWRECLYFFAQMSDDLTWLIKNIGHQIHNTKYRGIVEELIVFRPNEEIKRIEQLMDMYEEDIGYFVEDDLY